MKKIKDRISNFYNKLIKTKEKIWSHCLALFGLCVFLLTTLLIIIDGSTELIILGIYISTYLSIFISGCLILSILVLKKILTRDFNIKSNFILKNPIYNMIWILGQILTIINVSIILFYQLKPCIVELSHNIMGWLLYYN